MDIDETMKAEAAARASGGIVLGGINPPIDPEALMKLAAGEIEELKRQLEGATGMATTLANLFAALVHSLAEAGDQVPADGEVVVRIAGESTTRAEGARLRMLPQEDGSFVIAVVLTEYFERYQAAHAEEETP